ncbi:Vacuolar membrane protease [Dirofilaria immitis]
MGPNPEQNPRKQYGTDNDDDQENGNDWHIGYEIEMHGIGIEEYSGDDISDTKSESCDESNEDHYAGYQTLPTSNGSFDITSTNHEHTNVVFHKNFDEILTSENKDFDFEFDVPESIELTEDKIERIKKMMSTFMLPAPSWAKEIASDNELKKLLEKLKSK